MLRVLLALLLLNLASFPANAAGALGICLTSRSNIASYATSENLNTKEQAINQVLSSLINAGGQQCTIEYTFSNTCIAVVSYLSDMELPSSSSTYRPRWWITPGKDTKEAMATAYAQCRSSVGQMQCYLKITSCDTSLPQTTFIPPPVNNAPVINNAPVQSVPFSPQGSSIGPLFDTLGFFLIVAVIIGVIFMFLPAKSKVPQAPKLVVPPVQQLEPLAPGSVMRATIDPLPNNTIRLLIQLSDEARAIFDAQRIWERIIFEKPNPIYQVQMRAYQDAWASYESAKQSNVETIRWFAKQPIDPEPSKTIYTTVSEFCNPQGFVRAFPTTGEAKAWTTELRTHIENLKDIIEQNKAPPQKETFDF
jgi:hypothetical protein